MLGLALSIVLVLRDTLLQVTTGQSLMMWLAERRVAALDELAEAIDVLASPWAILFVRVGVVVVLAFVRRWRHLLVFLGSVVAVSVVASTLQSAVGRPRPTGIEILLAWKGFSFPDVALAALAGALAGLTLALVPPGRRRLMIQIVVGIGLCIVGGVRLYGGAVHFLDALFALLIGLGIPTVFFLTWAPASVYPVTYGRGGKSAHLDVSGRRGEAIRSAIGDQLGLDVVEVEPFGLSGSGASTPLRITVADVEGHLFGKLLASTHVRADRWYKVGRTIVYGALEDEQRFMSVRRLVEYEDYALRLLDDAGFEVAKSYGIVEITPQREYLLVTSFFEGAKELGESELSEDLIDQGLDLVRRLWDNNLAHRDIKPANLLVRDGRVVLVDVGFLEVHPTPWRQAVDLANMMLTLALQTDAVRVYERALLRFSPQDIAEGFAAARGLAIPTQVSARLKADRRPLVQEFRSLAPARDPISIQRWSWRRLAVTAGTLVVALILGTAFVSVLLGGLS